jgi:hypothetical protein
MLQKLSSFVSIVFKLKRNSLRIDQWSVIRSGRVNLGAITQPLRMEYRQTQINEFESGGKTSQKLGPSTLKVNNLEGAINNRYFTKVNQPRFLAGEILL